MVNVKGNFGLGFGLFVRDNGLDGLAVVTDPEATPRLLCPPSNR